MARKLPARPNLDHLRRQAKRLLSDLQAGHPAAAALIREHLPSATTWTESRILATRFRLADAQSAIARQTGFAAWPHLARHVDQLRALEGTWSFTRLEIDGEDVPVAGLGDARILMDGDRFRSETPEGVYEGVFNIRIEAKPQEIDIEFVAGPEAGRWNHGIFRLAGDELELCLDLNGGPRPRQFRTRAGSGHAWEALRRVSASRPEGVTGGAPPLVQSGTLESGTGPGDAHFPESPLVRRLQGEWSAVQLVRDGRALPGAMLRTALRTATGNEVKILVGGKTVLHARVRFDEATEPFHVDYFDLEGSSPRPTQEGILRWEGDEACFCMSEPGCPRPTEFTCAPGSGRTLSRWRRKG